MKRGDQYPEQAMAATGTTSLDAGRDAAEEATVSERAWNAREEAREGPRKHNIVSRQQVLDCIDARMSVRRMAEVLRCSESGLRQACSLFGWSPHRHARPKANSKTLPPKVTPGPKRDAHKPFGSMLQVAANG